MKKLFMAVSLAAVCCSALGKNARQMTVAVVVDKATYEMIGVQVDEFVSSMSLSGKRGVLVVDRWGHPDSIRCELKHLYDTENLEGAILVGDIPIAMVRDAQHLTTAFKMNQKYDWKRSSIPSDRFYDDFDLKFDYLRQDADKHLLHYYSLRCDSPQSIKCDIYSSRIKPPMIPGVGKYEAVAAYLAKAVAQKKEGEGKMSGVLYFAGHGYNSDSFKARIDEAWALRHQFHFLENERTSRLDFINYDQDRFIRSRLKAALADSSYDLAILHHHGSSDCQLLGATPHSGATSDWLEYSKIFFRGKMRYSSEPEKTREKYMKMYGVPSSFFDDYMEKSASDSTFYADMDNNIPDMYGYRSNARIVILDACFNGAFCEDDYIAGYYIFNPGATMCVKANSVNTLQDTWTNELMGLMDCGVCFGNWAKGQLTLESHLFGDASFAFASGSDVEGADMAMSRDGDSRYWRKMLSSEITDLRCSAIKHLAEDGSLSSDYLMDVLENDANPVVRLEAFMSLVRRNDSSFEEAVVSSLDDSYELLRRLGTKYLAKIGDPALCSVIERHLSDKGISQRVEFHLKSMKSIYFMSEKDTRQMLSLSSDSVSVKEKKFAISAQRNECNPVAVEPMYQYYKICDDAAIRASIAEAYGWYVYSYIKADVMDKCRELLAAEDDRTAADELRKTIARLENR